MISDSDDIEICTVDDVLDELSSDSSDEESEQVAQYSNPNIPIVTVPQGSSHRPYIPPSYSYDEGGGSVARSDSPEYVIPSSSDEESEMVAQSSNPYPPTVAIEPSRPDSPDYNPPRHPPKTRKLNHDGSNSNHFYPPLPPPISRRSTLLPELHQHWNFDKVMQVIREDQELKACKALEDIPLDRLDSLYGKLTSYRFLVVGDLLGLEKKGYRLPRDAQKYLLHHMGEAEVHLLQLLWRKEYSSRTLSNQVMRQYRQSDKFDQQPDLEHGPQLLEDLREHNGWKKTSRAMYMGTHRLLFLHPELKGKLTNTSTLSTNIRYPIGFGNEEPDLLSPEFNLERELDKRAAMMWTHGKNRPLLIEFIPSATEGTQFQPISHHLVGFMMVLKRVRIRWAKGSIGMTLTPPMPIPDKEIGTYDERLQAHLDLVKLAQFLGFALGVPVVPLPVVEERYVPTDMCQRHSQDMWYRKKPHWNKVPVFDVQGRPTTEYHRRVKYELDEALKVLSKAPELGTEFHL